MITIALPKVNSRLVCQVLLSSGQWVLTVLKFEAIEIESGCKIEKLNVVQVRIIPVGDEILDWGAIADMKEVRQGDVYADTDTEGDETDDIGILGTVGWDTTCQSEVVVEIVPHCY